MVQSILQLSGVTRRFGAITAVDDLSFEVRRGETVALLGPNGAGKTTALEMILGLLPLDGGAISVVGGSPAEATARGRVGAMLQEGGLPPGAKVAELVELVRSLYPTPLPLADALRMGGLETIAGRRVERLSGGEQQRVRLGVALAGGPELLVLDEPTAAMDVESRRSFWSGLADYLSRGRSLLFATHRLEEADEVADRVLVMANGRLVAEGAPREVKAAATGHSEVSFRSDGIPLELLEQLSAVEGIEVKGHRVALRTRDPERTVRDLLQGIPLVEGLEITGPRLEDAFLTLTSEGRPR